MAQTDPNDIYDGQRSGRRWTFQGMLDGLKATFGLGPKFIITAGANNGAMLPGAVAPDELKLAQKQIARNGPRYWDRMQKSEHKLNMWKNDYEKLVDIKLRENFHPENYRRMTLMKHTATNLLQRIVHDLSLTYENPPRRYFKEDVIDVNEAPGEGQTPATGEKDDIETAARPTPPVPPNPGEPPEPVIPDKAAAPNMLNTGVPEIDDLANELQLEGANKRTDDDSLKTLADLTNLDGVMETVEQFSRFLPCVWIRPLVEYDNVVETQTTDANGITTVETVEDPKSGCLNYVIYTPDCADVVPDPGNPTEMAAFWYTSWELDFRGDMSKHINFWTDEKYIKLDNEWRILSIEDNPYGEIPVVPVRLGVPNNTFYLDGQGDDIYEASLEQCVIKTMQNCRTRDSSFKQLAISGDEKDVPSDQVLGGPTPFYTGDGGTVTVLDLEPNLQQWTDMARERSLEMAAKYGISAASYKQDGAPVSGFAKKLDMNRILSINRRGRKYFRKAEMDLYAMTRKVLAVRPVEDIGDLPDLTFQIDFAEPSFDENPKDQAETDAQRIKLNLESILSILKRENPDLNEVELLKMAAKNKKINDAFITKTGSTLLDLLASTGKGVNPQAATELGAPAAPIPPGGPGGKPFGK